MDQKEFQNWVSWNKLKAEESAIHLMERLYWTSLEKEEILDYGTMIIETHWGEYEAHKTAGNFIEGMRDSYIIAGNTAERVIQNLRDESITIEETSGRDAGMAIDTIRKYSIVSCGVQSDIMKNLMVRLQVFSSPEVERSTKLLTEEIIKYIKYGPKNR